MLGEHFKFEYNVILAKVPKVTFHSWACPGDQLIYTADLQDARPEGGSVTVTAMVGERLVADAQIVFVHLNSDDPQLSRIYMKNFVFRMNLLDILTVGKAGSGNSWRQNKPSYGTSPEASAADVDVHQERDNEGRSRGDGNRVSNPNR